MNADKLTVLLGHGLTGWALTAAALGIGMAETSMGNALVIRAIAAPIGYVIVSFIYFRFLAFSSPLSTALTFLAVAVGLDFVLVGLVVRHSLDLFGSLPGTWIPFLSAFGATYLMGKLVVGSQHRTAQPK